ncbi:hypothetical protein [Rosistilla oblonga]|uniref:hypothetical protein n=1 Tax=Rosistilla oblonga TaxID=2527990 RepID=UPI003A97E1CB
MAALEGYEPRSIDELGLLAMHIIGVTRDNRPVRCGLLGELLFKDAPVTMRGSAPYARIAGRVVRKLEGKGFACYEPKSGGWKLTSHGLAQSEARKPQGDNDDSR